MNATKTANRTLTVDLLNAELVELFRARERAQSEPAYLKGLLKMPADSDLISDLIEVTELLHDYCEEHGIELTVHEIQIRLLRAVKELEDDTVPPSTAYDKAMEVLFYGIEEPLLYNIS